MDHVFDSGPMIAYLTRERGFDIAQRILMDNPDQCYAHVINLAEVYYVTWRRQGKQGAESALKTLYEAGIKQVDFADEEFWKHAAGIKAVHPLALPDAFCLALGMRLNATVVTTDHKEFDPLVSKGFSHILFIR